MANDETLGGETILDMLRGRGRTLPIEPGERHDLFPPDYVVFSQRPRSKALENVAAVARSLLAANDHHFVQGGSAKWLDLRDALAELDATTRQEVTHGAPGESSGRGETTASPTPGNSQIPMEKPDAPVPAPREVGRSGGAFGIEAGAACASSFPSVVVALNGLPRLLMASAPDVDHRIEEFYREAFSRAADKLDAVASEVLVAAREQGRREALESVLRLVAEGRP